MNDTAVIISRTHMTAYHGWVGDEMDELFPDNVSLLAQHTEEHDDPDREAYELWWTIPHTHDQKGWVVER